jgi:hypothetical protein
LSTPVLITLVLITPVLITPKSCFRRLSKIRAGSGWQ